MATQQNLPSDHDDSHGQLSTLRKRALTKAPISNKRQRDKAIYDEVAMISNLEKLALYDTTPDTVARTVHEYIQRVQKNDCPARLSNW